MGKHRLNPIFLSEFSRQLRDGDLAAAHIVNGLLFWSGFEVHSRAIVGSAKVSWVVDIQHDDYLIPGFLSILDSKLRFVKAIQSSLNDWLESGRRTLMYSLGQLCTQSPWTWISPEEPSEDSIPSYAVAVSAVVLLSLVYHYLTGSVDRDVSKAYPRSSLDFRDIYVAIVLFLGAYVWIKFREVAFKGVHPRKLVDKQGGIKVVYEARLTPPMWNGRKVPRLELGRFATPQEAHNKFLIAAFYYNRSSSENCLLDGWFPVPPMSAKERSLTGLELRAWVIAQAKKVYEDFKKEEEAESALFQELFEACEVQATLRPDEVNVDPCGTSLLNSAEHLQPALASEAENSAMLDNPGLECASHSFDGLHEGFALPSDHSFGFQEGSALPVSQMPPNTESGMSLTGSDHLDLLQTRVSTQQQQISLQQQRISLQQYQIQRLSAQILELQHQQRIQQQHQLQEPRIQNPQWSYQLYLQEQQLQDVNQGVPVFAVEMERSIYQQNYSGLMAPPPDGGEAQEAFV